MLIRNSILAAAGAVALSTFAIGTQPAEAASPKIEKVTGVAKYFRSHTYTGGRFTRRMAAEAGYPDAIVIDRRFQIGDVYSCSIQNFKRNQKAIICD